jgi:hypothetical protein
MFSAVDRQIRHCGLYMELKKPAVKSRPSKGLSNAQREFMRDMRKVGYFANPAWSFKEARDTLIFYLNYWQFPQFSRYYPDWQAPEPFPL